MRIHIVVFLWFYVIKHTILCDRVCCFSLPLQHRKTFYFHTKGMFVGGLGRPLCLGYVPRHFFAGLQFLCVSV